MRIAFVLDDSLSRRGGFQTYVLTIAEWLTTRGHEVLVVSAGEPPEPYSFIHRRVPGIPAMRVNGNNVGLALPTPKRDFQKQVRRGEFDIVHVQFPQIFTNARTAINDSPQSTAVIASYHTAPFRRIDRLGLSILAKALKRQTERVDLFLPTSEVSRHWLRSAFAATGPIVPAPHKAPSPLTSLSRVPDTSKPKAIVFLGQLVPRKGCRQLIEAFAHLASEDETESQLQIVGTGSSERSLRALARHLKVSERVEFLGTVSDALRTELLKSAAVAVYPTLDGEGFGYVLTETLAIGVPMIAGRAPAYVELLKGSPAMLVDAREPRQLADAIKRKLVMGRSEREEEQRVAQAFAGAFEIERIGPRLEEHYRDVVRRKAAADD